ncbi:MAG TPA: peptidylprolyl isomerase [Fimbriimonas sp.]|nr:peptidylprolyl isomerase [Fimbriimonas sp.]
MSSPGTEEVAVLRTNLGEIVLRFHPEQAPGHVENFKKLAREGFYDGTKFHRVIPGFMIQGGDPNSKSDERARHGTGGPGYQIRAEFNSTKHKRGILSMARSSDPNSAGSQFFIMVADYPSLDNQYTAFGEVVSGMDVVDKIVALPRDQRDNPRVENPAVIETATIETR